MILKILKIPNKDFYVKLNVKDDIIELYDSATNRLIETISGNELGELVQKLKHGIRNICKQEGVNAARKSLQQVHKTIPGKQHKYRNAGKTYDIAF